MATSGSRPDQPLALSANDVTDALLTTTRSVRKRLDLDRPVARELVEECLRLAFQAPTGANSEGWGWVVVDDPRTKAAMAEIYRGGMRDHAGTGSRGGAEPRGDQSRVNESVGYLSANLEKVPMLLVPTMDSTFGDADAFGRASTWGSILPAVWSFMLALRSRGLGSAWTTIHLKREQEMAELLGIPYPQNTQAGLFPIAYTVGTTFSPADRSRSDARVYWNTWSGR